MAQEQLLSSNFRQSSAVELESYLLQFKREQFNLRLQKATGQDVGLGRIRQVRRIIARLKTIQTELASSLSARVF